MARPGSMLKGKPHSGGLALGKHRNKKIQIWSNLIYLHQQIASVATALGIGHSSMETVTSSPSQNGTGTTPSLPARRWEPSWSSSKVMKSRCDWLSILVHSSGYWQTRVDMVVYMVSSRKWATCSTWSRCSCAPFK